VKKRNQNIPILLRATRWAFPKLERWTPFLAQRIFRMVFYVPLKYRVPEKEREAEKSAAMFRLNVHRKKIQCYSWGDQSHPYVLLIHGWAGRATQFRKFIKPLNQAGLRVIGFDGPAHGRSEGRQTTILEFELTLRKIFDELGAPVAIITHSFGGAVALYSAMNGLPVRKLINIASPSIADEILKTYLRAINGSWPSAEKFKKFVVRKTGKTFEEFTSLHAVARLPQPVDLLMIQDSDDQDVYLVHAEALKKAYPSATLMKTSGLGHTRILKDDHVIGKCIEFIKA
jgi:pimeloyl-ACP methyl ester carboxylesterase